MATCGAVGRCRPRRHELQRCEELSFDHCRAGVRSRAHQRRQAIRCGSTFTTAASTAGTTARSPGTCCSIRPASGKARCGTSPTWPTAARAISRKLRRARHVLGIQRRARQPVGPVAAAGMEQAACLQVLKEADHGSDRRQRHLGVAWLPQLLRQLNGRAVQSVSGGSHWGGGSVGEHARSCPLRLSVSAQRRTGTATIVSERWVRMATTPTDIAPHYGYLVVAEHTAAKSCPARPSRASSHSGRVAT